MNNKLKYDRILKENKYANKKDPIRERADKLVEQGNIEEAIAVITSKGMESFADFIAFSIEDRIQKAIEIAVGKVAISMIDSLSTVIQEKVQNSIISNIESVISHKGTMEHITEEVAHTIDESLNTDTTDKATLIMGAKFLRNNEELVRKILSKPTTVHELKEQLETELCGKFSNKFEPSRMFLYFNRLGWEVEKSNERGTDRHFKLV